MLDFKKQKKSSKKVRGFDRKSPIVPEEKHDCGPRRKLVPRYRKEDGTYVKGHCSEIGNEDEWHQVERRRKTTYGLKPLPHFEITTEIIEKPGVEHKESNQDGWNQREKYECSLN